MTRQEIATKVAWSFLGKPYLWGGDDPVAGFDCSGFMNEVLKSVGALPRKGDWTAAALRDRFAAAAVAQPYAGCLVFYGPTTAGPITHVEFCLDGEHSIGASGGGSKTLSPADAVAQNAYIKVRPILSRAGIVAYVDPFREQFKGG